MNKNPVMANNAFVRAEQERMKKMMGDRPKMKAENSKFDAKMMNDGMAAEELCRKLTRDLDKEFPVK